MLKEFGYIVIGLSKDDILYKKLLIRQFVIETDIHPFGAGITYEEIWGKRIYTKYKDIEDPFLEWIL